MSKKSLVIFIVCVIFVGFFVWGMLEQQHASHEATLQRFTYEGRVTAVSNGERYSTIWLNSNNQEIQIKSPMLSLAVGEYYLITIDGNRNLINAIIIEGE